MAKRDAAPERPFVRRRVVVAGGILTALLLFALTFIAAFPYNAKVSQMLAPYQLRLVYQDQRLNLPFGVRLENVSLLSTADSGQAPLLESKSVALAPSLASILDGRTGVSLSAQIFNGVLRATIAQKPNAVTVDFDAHGLSLSGLPRFGPEGSALTGALSGKGSAEIQGAAITGDRGEATVRAEQVTLQITEGFPLIHLGEVTGHLLLSNGTLTFQDVETHGGDVDSRADGVIRLAPDLHLSTIEAQIALTPTPSGHDHFGLFFHMLPHPPDEGPYYVNGPLLAPTIT